MHLQYFDPNSLSYCLKTAGLAVKEVTTSDQLDYGDRVKQTLSQKKGISHLWGTLRKIPGVIAFAVDFSTGAIYLPSGKSKTARGMENHDLAVINMSPNDLNIAKLDEILVAHTGEEVNLESNTVLIYEADDNKSVERQLKELAQQPKF